MMCGLRTGIPLRAILAIAVGLAFPRTAPASEPALAARSSPRKMAAYHVDLRMPHFRPSYLILWLKELAENGYTHVVWELTDGVVFETCPEAATSDALT